MKFARVIDGVVDAVSLEKQTDGDWIEVPDYVYGGWLQSGEGFLAPDTSASMTVDDYKRAIEAHIEDVVAIRDYSSGVSLASYVASTVPLWKAEAEAFVAWRDAVWAYALQELQRVVDGEREPPTVEDFLAELPAMEWPL